MLFSVSPDRFKTHDASRPSSARRLWPHPVPPGRKLWPMARPWSHQPRQKAKGAVVLTSRGVEVGVFFEGTPFLGWFYSPTRTPKSILVVPILTPAQPRSCLATPPVEIRPELGSGFLRRNRLAVGLACGCVRVCTRYFRARIYLLWIDSLGVLSTLIGVLLRIGVP